MKNCIKGIITGLIIGAIISALPAMAETIDAMFNKVRINVNGYDEIQWDEDMELSDGKKTPASILYNGTTYLPMRKISLGCDVHWNGDSKTVSVTNHTYNEKAIAEKADKNGNVWKYAIYEDYDGYYYLNAWDKKRGYSRSYLMADSDVRVTDNEIYFTRLKKRNAYEYENQAYLVKLSFDNDENSQDGETIFKFYYPVETGNVVFDGDYVFVGGIIGGNGGGAEITAYNYITGNEIEKRMATWTRVSDLELAQSDEGSAKLKYVITGASGWIEDWELEFDKTTNTFGNSVSKERKTSEEVTE